MRRKHTYIATIWRYEWPHSHNRQAIEYNVGSAPFVTTPPGYESDPPLSWRSAMSPRNGRTPSGSRLTMAGVVQSTLS